MRGALRWRLLRRPAPLAARRQNVKDAAQNLPDVGPASTSAASRQRCDRLRYERKLTDGERAPIERPPPAWSPGRPRETDPRSVANAIYA